MGAPPIRKFLRQFRKLEKLDERQEGMGDRQGH